MTADFILEALREHYAQAKWKGQWAFFKELRVETGYGAKGGERRVDGYVLNLWPSKKFESSTFEVKVSRADFRKELKQPEKRWPGMAISNTFYFVTPPGLISERELPELCGLIEVDDDMNVKRIKRAVYRMKMGPSWGFMASICRRVALSEDDLEPL